MLATEIASFFMPEMKKIINFFVKKLLKKLKAVVGGGSLCYPQKLWKAEMFIKFNFVCG